MRPGLVGAVLLVWVSPAFGQDAGGRQFACGHVWDLRYAPDGKVLAIGYNDTKAHKGHVALWDAGGEPVVVGPDEGFHGRIAFTRDGKRLVAASGVGLDGVAGLARVWDTSSRKLLAELKLDSLPRAIALGGDKDQCLIPSPLSNAGRPFAVWDLDAGKERPLQWTPYNRSRLLCMAVSPDGRTLATHQDGGEVLLWDLPDAREVRRLPVGDRLQPLTACLAFAPGGKTLATGHNLWFGDGGDKKLVPLKDPTHIPLWEPATGELKAGRAGDEGGGGAGALC